LHGLHCHRGVPAYAADAAAHVDLLPEWLIGVPGVSHAMALMQAIGLNREKFMGQQVNRGKKTLRQNTY
jgi:hypothetical protein